MWPRPAPATFSEAPVKDLERAFGEDGEFEAVPV
jgi:hypothetical protein